MNTFLTAFIAGLAVVGSAPANAQHVHRGWLSNAVANCQPALPIFDGNIRKRPMGVGNEGSATAFVTCGFEQHNGNGAVGVEMYFVNIAGSPNVVVQCSLVNGFINRGLVLTKTTEPISVGGQGWLQWTATDHGDFPLQTPAVSCALPPGVSIAGSGLTFLEFIGEF